MGLWAPRFFRVRARGSCSAQRSPGFWAGGQASFLMQLRPVLAPSSPAAGHLWRAGTGRGGGCWVRSLPSPAEARGVHHSDSDRGTRAPVRVTALHLVYGSSAGGLRFTYEPASPPPKVTRRVSASGTQPRLSGPGRVPTLQSPYRPSWCPWAAPWARGVGVSIVTGLLPAGHFVGAWRSQEPPEGGSSVATAGSPKSPCPSRGTSAFPQAAGSCSGSAG